MILFALLGLAVGSFLNVCMDRLPTERSLLHPPSRCDACGRALAPRDLIPVISYLWLRGRCRYCGAAIPRRILLVELVTGLLFASLWWAYGASAQLLFSGFYSCLFIIIFVIDLEHGLILNKVVYPAMLITLVIALFWPDLEITSSLAGGGAGFALLLVPAVVYRGAMGWGDVKMAGLIGLMAGFPLALVALLIALLSGGVVAGGLLLLGLKRRREAIPFGPFLAAGALITLFWGDAIYQWYQELLF